MKLKRRVKSSGLGKLYENLEKLELSEQDKLALASLAQEFKDSNFYMLFLAITARERELITLNRQMLENSRPDFVLGMIHENSVIERSIDNLITEGIEIRKKKHKPEETPMYGEANIPDFNASKLD